MKTFRYLPIFFVFLSTQVLSKNILFFHGWSTYSHRISFWPLVERLADKGHNVTFLSAHPVKPTEAHPKVQEIVPKSLENFVQQFSGPSLLDARFTVGSEKLWFSLVELSISAHTSLLEDEEFLKWFQNAEFDLIFIDAFFSEIAYALAYKTKANFAILSTCAPYSWQYDAFGIPVEHSWLPDMQWHYPEDMSLYYRIMNTYRTLEWVFFRAYTYYPQLEALFRTRLGLTDMPNLLEFEKSVSLVLANTHYAEDYGRSLPPLVVPVGGMHCFKSKDSTPTDMEKFMNHTGSEGFILVSFGSAAELSGMSDNLKAIFFEAMRKARTSFLLKWNSEIPKDMPKNVYTASWLPQQNVLAHPNIKGFITHGGLLGIHEAICSAVPLIVAPIFAEQEYNANRIHNRRRGIKIELTTLTQGELDSAIASLLTDKSYKRNMEEASRLFTDRPQKPVDTAEWWTEFILRHGQVNELKPLGIHQSWFQRRLLDVWLVVFSVLFLFPLVAIIAVLILSRKDYDSTRLRKKRE